MLKEACSAKHDIQALSYLSNIELKQSANDPRPFELIFVRPSLTFTCSPETEHTVIIDTRRVEGMINEERADIGQHFAENPYFTNTTLTKTYSLQNGEQPPADEEALVKAMQEWQPLDLDASVRSSFTRFPLDGVFRHVGL